MKRLLWPCILLGFVACGGSSGGSGVSSSKKLNALSMSEQDKLCTFILDAVDAPRTVACSDGTTVTLDASTQCDFSGIGASCEATVGDTEGCADAFGKDPCKPDLNACAALFTCALSG